MGNQTPAAQSSAHKENPMNKFFNFPYTLVCLGIMLVTAACAPTATAIPATVTPSNTITNIVWEWTSVTNRTTGVTTTVADPQNYTITFRTDGTLSGKADCNPFTGTYSQVSGFSIKIETSTMAACGDASLDQTYFQLLSEIAAGGPDGTGNLALETAGGEKRMLFKNGGAAK
jgi:heat shock protein HslJ